MRQRNRSVLLLAAFFCSCGFIEQPSRYFEFYDVSLHEGMWIPKIFPHDITEIHEQHVIDTNEVWMRFRLGETPLQPSEYGYELIQREEVEAPYRLPTSAPWKHRWWPETFSESFRFYRGSHLGAVAFLALGEEGIVYWWVRAT